MRTKRHSEGYLNSAIAYSKGVPACTALKHAAYSESRRMSASRQALESRHMRFAFRRLGTALAEDLAAPAETLAFLQDEESEPRKVREMVSQLMEQYDDKADRQENPCQAIKEFPALSKVLLWNDPPHSWTKQPKPAPMNAPDVDIAPEDPLHRREIVTQQRFIRSMHQFLGVE